MNKIIPLLDRRQRPTPLPNRLIAGGGALADTLGRPLRDLRISVTDRCNFRCVYCMPKEIYGRDYSFLPHAELLSFEEIARLAKIFKEFGVEKIRLTGGEPLLRKHIERLIAMLADLELDLTLTTNGALLARKAQSLKNAGLRRITVSLDSLDDARFRAMNDVNFPVKQVLEGIAAATEVGLQPIKINAVVKKGLNDGDVLSMARYFKNSGLILRFIEYMDVGHTNGWCMDQVVPSRDLIRLIDAKLPIEPIEANYSGEVAERWRYRDGSGEIGFISSVTQAFCRDCTRARLSTDGKLYTCLFATSGYDFKTWLRSGATDAEIGGRLAALWGQRADRYSEIRSEHSTALAKVEMSYIGG